ncbi:hypothetical protein JW964_13565 [candidate division KSB1 bacterium]|nr:hypothetical protein [candidate division KSB1 bacterium]
MDKFCFSCAAPLSLPQFQGPAKDYCINCADSKGNLKPRDEIKSGMAQWFKMWQPGLNDEKAIQRAEYYLKSMPAWAES